MTRVEYTSAQYDFTLEMLDYLKDHNRFFRDAQADLDLSKDKLARFGEHDPLAARLEAAMSGLQHFARSIDENMAAIDALPEPKTRFRLSDLRIARGKLFLANHDVSLEEFLLRTSGVDKLFDYCSEKLREHASLPDQDPVTEDAREQALSKIVDGGANFALALAFPHLQPIQMALDALKLLMAGKPFIDRKYPEYEHSLNLAIRTVAIARSAKYFAYQFPSVLEFALKRHAEHIEKLERTRKLFSEADAMLRRLSEPASEREEVEERISEILDALEISNDTP